MSQRVNDFTRGVNGVVDLVKAIGGLLHSGDAAVHFLARAIGNVQQYLGGICHALDRGHHLVNRSRGFTYTRGLRLRALHHVLHVHTHLVHGAGDFINGGGGLQADLGGLVGGACNLVGSAGHLRGRVSHVAYQASQSLHHAEERIAQSVMLGARLHLHGQVAAGDRFGNRSHLFQINHHIAKGPGQFADFILALYVDGVVEVTSISDLPGHHHQIGEGFGDGLGTPIGDCDSQTKCQQSAE